ncbi:MAG: stage II sporulation protein M, partial [Clostridiaceae bacterium]|nr:stage II sporulation protein M [Clostridiaceae bacterium]
FVFMLGSAISFIFTLISVDNAIAFLPKEQVDAILDSDVYGARESWDNSVMSSFILTNNIRVGIISFVLGITMGVGTSWVLLVNGYMLGGFAALYFHKGANLLFWSLILPHGVIELLAIFICGGAGIIVGYSLINPLSYSRKDSLIIRGKTALKLVLGTIPMFIIAGIIEGNITPSDKISEAGKLVFALFTLLLFAVYIIVPNMKYRLKDKIL